MVITQTVDIPPSRRLTIDVPREVPAGKAILVFKPLVEESLTVTAQEAVEAIKRCSGITKRYGITLSSDDFLAARRQDKELENQLDSGMSPSS